jgi:hypothetical protein
MIPSETAKFRVQILATDELEAALIDYLQYMLKRHFASSEQPHPTDALISAIARIFKSSFNVKPAQIEIFSSKYVTNEQSTFDIVIIEANYSRESLKIINLYCGLRHVYQLWADDLRLSRKITPIIFLTYDKDVVSTLDKSGLLHFTLDSRTILPSENVMCPVKVI